MKYESKLNESEDAVHFQPNFVTQAASNSYYDLFLIDSKLIRGKIGVTITSKFVSNRY